MHEETTGRAHWRPQQARWWRQRIRGSPQSLIRRPDENSISSGCHRFYKRGDCGGHRFASKYAIIAYCWGLKPGGGLLRRRGTPKIPNRARAERQGGKGEPHVCDLSTRWWPHSTRAAFVQMKNTPGASLWRRRGPRAQIFLLQSLEHASDLHGRPFAPSGGWNASSLKPASDGPQ
jgi:hypothetical protein